MNIRSANSNNKVLKNYKNGFKTKHLELNKKTENYFL